MAPVIPANSPLLNPGKPLSGNSLLQAAQGLAHAQTSPVLSALLQQIAQNNQQTSGAIKQVGGFYNQLGTLAGNDATQVGQVASGLNSQLQGIGNDEQSQLQGIGQNALASLAKYAPQSDSSDSLLGPAAQSLVAESARQQGLAAQNQGAFRSFGATQGANQQNLANSNLGTFALGGQEALHNIAQAGQVRNEPLMAKIANTKALYGADLATALGRLRQQQIDNQIARQGLGIKQQSANAATSNATTARINAGTRQKALGITKGHDLATQALGRAQLAERTHNDAATQAWHQAALNAKRVAGGGQPKPLSGVSQSHLYGTLNQAISLVQTGRSKHVADSKIRQDLGGHFKIPDVFVQAAFDLVTSGAISAQTAAQMHNLGLRGGTYRGQPIKVAHGGRGSQKQVIRNAAGSVSPGALKNIFG